MGVSRRELADVVGEPCQKIEKYENGENTISAGQIQQFAKVLKVPPSVFYGAENEYFEQMWDILITDTVIGQLWGELPKDGVRLGLYILLNAIVDQKKAWKLKVF